MAHQKGNYPESRLDRLGCWKWVGSGSRGVRGFQLWAQESGRGPLRRTSEFKLLRAQTLNAARCWPGRPGGGCSGPQPVWRTTSNVDSNPLCLIMVHHSPSLTVCFFPFPACSSPSLSPLPHLGPLVSFCPNPVHTRPTSPLFTPYSAALSLRWARFLSFLFSFLSLFFLCF